MPRTFTVEKTVYKLQELEGSAREKALDWLREGATQFDWWDHTYEDAKTIGKLMGIEINDISFSGFWSQGDGASFTGHYSYAKGAAAAVREYAPEDKELHRIVDKLQAIQREFFYQLSAHLTRTMHHYSHENTVGIEVFRDGDYSDSVSAEIEKELLEVFRDFMRWIYKSLEAEYEYQTSEEQLIEMADANEYEFTATGSIA